MLPASLPPEPSVTSQALSFSGAARFARPLTHAFFGVVALYGIAQGLAAKKPTATLGASWAVTLAHKRKRRDRNRWFSDPDRLAGPFNARIAIIQLLVSDLRDPRDGGPLSVEMSSAVSDYFMGERSLPVAAKVLAPLFPEAGDHADAYARVFLVTWGLTLVIKQNVVTYVTQTNRPWLERYLRALLENDPQAAVLEQDGDRLFSEWPAIRVQLLRELKDRRFSAATVRVENVPDMRERLAPILHALGLAAIGDVIAHSEADFVAWGVGRTDINHLRFVLSVNFGEHLKGEAFYAITPENPFTRELDLPLRYFMLEERDGLLTFNHLRLLTANPASALGELKRVDSSLVNILAPFMPLWSTGALPPDLVPVASLPLPSRTKNALEGAHLYTLADVLDCVPVEWMHMRGIGPEGALEVQHLIKHYTGRWIFISKKPAYDHGFPELFARHLPLEAEIKASPARIGRLTEGWQRPGWGSAPNLVRRNFLDDALSEPIPLQKVTARARQELAKTRFSLGELLRQLRLEQGYVIFPEFIEALGSDLNREGLRHLRDIVYHLEVGRYKKSPPVDILMRLERFLKQPEGSLLARAA